MTDPLGQLRLHFTGLSLQEEVPQGQVFSGTDATGTQVTIAVLAASLASQPGVRNAFADVVWRHSVGSEPGRVTVYAADLHAALPWAAIRGRSGEPGAEQLLAALASAAPTAPVPTAPIPPPPPPLPPGIAPTTPTPTPTFQQPAFQAPGAQAPGGQAPGFPAPGFPPSVPAHQPPPAGQSRGPWPWVIGATGAVAAIGLVAVAALVGMRVLGDDEPDPPITLPTGQPPVESPTPTDSPAPAPSTGPTGEPELRDVDLVSVVGPNFADDDDTFTMAFRGWPFAFRTPGDWDCLKGDAISLFPGAEFWGCRDLLNGGEERQRATVMLWACDGDCDQSEQREKLDAWLDAPDDAVQWEDSPTYYVETEEDEDGLYSVDLGHFTGVGSDGLRWMVGVYIESPPDTREDVQKLLNDVISQSSGA